MIKTRAERLIAGDVILCGNSSWHVHPSDRAGPPHGARPRRRPPNRVTPGDCRAGPRLSGHPPRLTRHEVNAWAIKEDKPLIRTS